MKNFAKIKLRSEVVYQVNEDGMMLYVPDEGMVHAVNKTAADIIMFIEQGDNNLEMIVEQLENKYIGINRDDLTTDVKGILNSMEEIKVIEEV